jgi:hypothetical protein
MHRPPDEQEPSLSLNGAVGITTKYVHFACFVVYHRLFYSVDEDDNIVSIRSPER